MKRKNLSHNVHIVAAFIVFGALISGLQGEGGNLSEEYIFSEEAAVSQILNPDINQNIKRNEANVPIIVYHSIRPAYSEMTPLVREFTVDPSVFEEQISYLKKNNYEIISFADLYAHLNQDKPLPDKAAIITFDDGWENQYTYALPILKKYHISATFFIYTNAIGQKHYFTWDQVRELSSTGMTIGGHSKSHPYLREITDWKTLEEEISDSKKIIEQNVGKPVEYFAYPFGQYNAMALETVRKAGYKLARSSIKGMWNSTDDIYTLRSIQAATTLPAFINSLIDKNIALNNKSASDKLTE